MARHNRSALLTVIALVVIAVLLVPIIYFGSQWVTFGRDAPAKDYVASYNELALKIAGVRTPAENNWPLVSDIEADFAAVDEQFGIARGPRQSPAVDYGALDDPEADGELRAAAAAALAELDRRGTWEKLDRLAANPAAAGQFAGGTSLFNADVPFGRSRQAARATMHRLRTALAAQDSREALRMIEHAMTLSRVAGQQPLLITRLVGIAIESGTREVLRTSVLESRPDEQTLRRMIALQEQHALPPFAETLEGERLAGQQLLYDTLGASPLRPINRGAQIARHDLILNTAAAYISAPRQQRDPVLAAQLNRFANLGPSYTPVSIVVPAFENAFRADDQNITDRHATIILLAVEAHIARAGHPPAALDDLVTAGILTRIPDDPFAKDGFRYRRLDAAVDPGVRCYILYSVGLDGRDDGGTPAARPHDAFSGRAPGTDFIFSRSK
jgi:hypothetical protein